MTCKDCVHYQMCYLIEHYGADEDKACVCKDFKNKSDYAEVKHGEWLQDFDEDYYCSKCGHYPKADVRDYCPNCGAKMVGKNVFKE